jgi:CheY-like chemotaxis protein
VFVNLLVNAAQAIGVGHADANEISVTTSESESGVVVVLVRDTGPGIAPDALPLVFNPFFTTKGQGGGTGLGLSICHGIVSALGGTITASNTESRGAVFRVELPGVHGGEVASKPPSTASSNVPQERKRVLIVDDEVKVALVCKMTLEPSFDVVVTRSASEALDLLAKDERFDVILCDLMMPVRTGIELYAGVERSHPQLRERIVFMTGGATTDATRAFLDSAPNMRVDKPFTVEELLAVVSSGVGG